MDFVTVVDQVVALLRQKGRVTYRTLKRLFQLDDTALEDLTVELIKGQRLAADKDGEVLVWIGDTAAAPAPAAAPVSASAPLAYIPPMSRKKFSPPGPYPGRGSGDAATRGPLPPHTGEKVMRDTSMRDQPFEVHDPDILAQARSVLNACQSGKSMQDAVIAAVKRNEQWRGAQCINLLAPEAPTSPAVRALLAAEVGIRAAEGHIGKVNRWFAGTVYIDEIEALCVELLKRVFRSRYADHRLVASMIGNLTAYTALTEPGDVIMSIAQPFGGHSSNRIDGPAGVRGLKIVDVPMDPTELVVDLDVFRKTAPLVRPKLVALGASLTLFPFPLQEMSAIVAEWGGKLFFDGAHQIGLIAGGQFQDPLREGAVVMTGSAGKTFSGPQSGIIVWDDPSLTPSLTHAIFPVLAATHQVNRVAALAVAAAEMLEFGHTYMAQIVRNAHALGASLEQRGIPVFGAHKGYTRTHQVLADVRAFGGGLDVAHLLARANIVTNKNLLPSDTPRDWDRPSGLRLGTIEVTRLGMREKEMDFIADFMARVLVEKLSPDTVVKDVIEFRQGYQTLYYNFDHALPPQ